MSDDLQIFEDLACTLCGCVCDDLQITVRQNRILEMQNACQHAEPWLLAQNTRSQTQNQIRGQSVPLEDARQEGLRLLQSSRNPLFYGLSSSSTVGQRAACHLADRIGAIIDTSASTCHAPSIMALQRVGESTCSLGEIKNRSDLVIYWGSNPIDSHPRHLERYVSPDAHRVVVDTRFTETAEQAETFLQIEPQSDFEVLSCLRGLVRGIDLETQRLGHLPVQQLQQLAKRMVQSQHVAFFFGLGLTNGCTPHLNVEALLKLATDLHQHTRCVVRRMRRYGDVAGADSVLCWQTGYPFSVSLNRPWPRYNPGEFSAQDLLSREEPDLILLVGTDGIDKLNDRAVEWLNQVPSIVLAHHDVELPFSPTVFIPVATYAVHLPGTAYRMDETPIPLRPFLKTHLVRDDEVLQDWIRYLESERSS